MVDVSCEHISTLFRSFRRMAGLLLATTICLMLNGCHGDEHPASQLLLFKDLPPGADLSHSQHLNIRSNFQVGIDRDASG